ncbi:hypothetical protein [Amycolatopsis sp. NPDC059657]|uniref:hypothetical protein n=1 Tax=Amycolatopsis sp. NPDC059657 TaxID=3346899 RepID=UPI00366E07D8
MMLRIRTKIALLAGVLVLAAVAVVVVIRSTGESGEPAPSTAAPVEAVQAAPPTSSATSPPPRTEHDKLDGNQLFVAGVTPDKVSCALPKATVRADIEPFLRAELKCLDDAWRPVLERAGAPFESTEIALDPTLCRFDPAERGPHYCARDNKFYVSPAKIAEEGFERAFLIGLLSQRYGNHLMDLVGINDARANLPQAATTEAAKQENLRRAILLTDCLSGMSLAALTSGGSLTDAEARKIITGWQNAIGDPDGATKKNVGKWLNAGFAAKDASACNTWAASSADVA